MIKLILLLSLGVFNSYAQEVSPIKLNPEFIGEEKQKEEPRTHYFTEKERKQFIITISPRGRLLTASGEPLNTTGLRNDAGQFVVDLKGVIYASRLDSPVTYDHSSYLAGKDVLCAGFWIVADGEIQMIADISGKYPSKSDANLKWFVKNLKEKNVSFEGVSIVHDAHPDQTTM